MFGYAIPPAGPLSVRSEQVLEVAPVVILSGQFSGLSMGNASSVEETMPLCAFGTWEAAEAAWVGAATLLVPFYKWLVTVILSEP
jgi:hypothetical protein